MPPNDDAEAGFEDAADPGVSAAANQGPLQSAASEVLLLMDLDSDGDGGTFRAIDPTIMIQMIMDAIMKALAACRNPSPADIRATASNPGIMAKLKVRRACNDAVRAKLGSRMRLGAAQFNRMSDEMFDALFGAAESADVDKIAAVRKAAVAA